MGETEILNPPVTGAVTVSEKVAVCVMPPPTPDTVMVYVPAAVVEATVSDKVDVPEPVIEVGLKVPVTPVGRPLTDKATAESNPSTTVDVMVELPLEPCRMETDVAERL